MQRPTFVSELFHVKDSEIGGDNMSEEKPYQIKIEKQLIDVTVEVYLAYYRMKRYERFVEEQDVIHEILYYSGFDTEKMNG